MASVGMLAPLFEAFFHGSFMCIDAQFFKTSLPATDHLRWAASGKELWDCHFFYKGKKKWDKDLVRGIIQLAEATSTSSHKWEAYPFQANPEGRWRFGRLSALLAPYVRISVCSSLGALKIGQIADGGMSPTYETMY